MRFQCHFDQDVEYPMNACLSPEPSHASPPINPRLDVLAGDKDRTVITHAYLCLEMLS